MTLSLRTKSSGKREIFWLISAPRDHPWIMQSMGNPDAA
jgi:hypothetical protein